MVKKILGGLFWVLSALILIGSIANGSFMSDRGSVAATYGAFAAIMIVIITNIFAGIFLMRFDGVYKKTYVEGFKVRKKQCSKIVLFIVVYGVFMLFASIGVVVSGTDNFFLTYIIAELPYFIPLMIFAAMLGSYAIPYWACQKNIKPDNVLLNEYLSVNETFYTYCEDNSVIASNKVLFFPKIFCMIPFDRIATTKFKNIVIEQDAVITLTSGRKIYILASKKQYDGIVSAISAHKQI